MMRALVTLGLFLSTAWVSRAATVTVLRPDGRAAASAAVMCRGHEKEPALTGDDGRAMVPEDCSFVTCMAGGYVPGTVSVVSGTADCRLIDGVRVTLRVAGSACGAHCFASLTPLALDGDRVSREVGDDSDTAVSEVQLGVVRPGPYRVELIGEPRGTWMCGASVELRRTGAETIAANWRPPFQLHGLLIADNGSPVADVPVRVRPSEPSPERPAAAWRCSAMEGTWAPELFSAGDGSFVVAIDPTIGGVIEAGSSWDPDGSASVQVTPPLPPSVVLPLKRDR